VTDHPHSGQAYPTRSRSAGLLPPQSWQSSYQGRKVV